MADFDEIAVLIQAGIINNNEAEEEIVEHRRRRRPADNDPFHVLSEEQFKKLFRLPKHLVQRVIEMVEPHIENRARRSALSVSIKVLISLRFFASGSYQMDIANNIHFGVSQSSVSNCITEVSNALTNADILREWVHFPNTLEELKRIRQQFYHSYGFPEVIGCIDCTHVAIVPPEMDVEHAYVNRKQYHSINCQLICDRDMKIISANCRFPGRTHDAYILQHLNIRNVIEDLAQQHNGYYLLGDSGYPLRPWLLTPINGEQQPGTPEHGNNVCHKRTRSLIKRCNGVLKMRFRCLLKHRVLHYAPEKAAQIIQACIVLHNICIDNNVELDEEVEEDDIDLGVVEEALHHDDVEPGARRINPDLAAGRALRRLIIANYFNV